MEKEIKNKKLSSKFSNSFMPIVIVAIVSSFSLTVALLQMFINTISSNERVKEVLSDLSYFSAVSSLLTVRSMLFYNFQLEIDNLNTFNDYLDYFMRVSNSTSNDVMIEFIEKYGRNAYDLANNNQEMIKLKNANTFDYFNYGVWFIDHNKTLAKDLTRHEIIRIYSFLNLIPVMRSIYEPFALDDTKGPLKSTIFFEKFEITCTYPIFLETEKYSNYKSFKYSSFCKNKAEEQMSYYYPKCEDWYKDNESLLSNTISHTVSPPSFFNAESKIGNTISKSFKNNENNEIIKLATDKVGSELYKREEILKMYSQSHRGEPRMGHF